MQGNVFISASKNNYALKTEAAFAMETSKAEVWNVGRFLLGRGTVSLLTVNSAPCLQSCSAPGWTWCVLLATAQIQPAPVLQAAEQHQHKVSFIFAIFTKVEGKKTKNERRQCGNSPFGERRPTDFTFNAVLPCQETMFTE